MRAVRSWHAMGSLLYKCTHEERIRSGISTVSALALWYAALRTSTSTISTRHRMSISNAAGFLWSIFHQGFTWSPQPYMHWKEGTAISDTLLKCRKGTAFLILANEWVLDNPEPDAKCFLVTCRRGTVLLKQRDLSRHVLQRITGRHDGWMLWSLN